MARFDAASVSLAARVGHYAIGVLATFAIGAGAVVVFGTTHVVYAVHGREVVVEASLAFLDEGRRAQVERAELIEVSGGRRLRGTGRPDYCSGYFSYTETGEVWQATRCGREVVLLETHEGRWIVEPADRHGFVAAVEAGSDARFEAAAPHRRWPPWSLGFLAGLFAVIVAFVGGSLLRGPLHYEVEAGRLSVPGIVGRFDVSLSGAKAWRDRRGRRRWLRAFGVGTTSLHLGVYRGEGRWLRVAATRLDDVVFVEADGRVFVLSAESPDALLAALEAEGVEVREEVRG